MLLVIPIHPSNNPEPARPAFFGLVFGLKNGGCQWISWLSLE
jgi:CDP-diacylglycerol--glycerol-3-phosphate 3-phosphatidyltransferase